MQSRFLIGIISTLQHSDSRCADFVELDDKGQDVHVRPALSDKENQLKPVYTPSMAF